MFFLFINISLESDFLNLMLHFGFCLVYQDKEERYKHNTEYNGKYQSEEKTPVPMA